MYATGAERVGEVLKEEKWNSTCQHLNTFVKGVCALMRPALVDIRCGGSFA